MAAADAARSPATGEIDRRRQVRRFAKIASANAGGAERHERVEHGSIGATDQSRESDADLCKMPGSSSAPPRSAAEAAGLAAEARV